MILTIKVTKEGNMKFSDKLFIFFISFWCLWGFEVMYNYDIQDFIKEAERVMKEAHKKKVLESLPKN